MDMTPGGPRGERPVLRKQIHTVSAGDGYECPGMEQELMPWHGTGTAKLREGQAGALLKRSNLSRV